MKTNFEAKLWPGAPEGHVLFRHLEEFVPELEIPNFKEGKENAMPVQAKFNAKILNQNKQIKAKLRKMGRMEPSTKKRKLSSEPSVEMEDHLKDFAMAFDTKPSGGEGGLTHSVNDTFSEYLSGAEDELSHLLDI